MKDLELIIYPHPVLRRKSKEVEKIDEVRDILNKMWEVMYTYKGIGLAAPQVGINKRVMVMDVESKKICLINPYIIEKEGVVTEEEGCLSLPDIFLPVPRAQEIVVEGWDEEGKKVKLKMGDLMARVVQHEVDHLEGVLIIDYASPSQRIKLEKILKNRREK
ncbi:peptide deformylase [Candidatus Calescamantes bacterium]|nr:peptide deformylase [Candidatus Calescamantes bacterium]